MPLHCRKHTVLSALLACATLSTALSGQTAAEKPAGNSSTNSDDVYTLSDFVVKAEADSGYGAANAYTATRVGMPILKTPLNVQVVTEQLMEDQGVNSFQNMLKFVSGVNGDQLNKDGGNVNLLGSATFNIRGFVPNVVLRNGFRRPNNLIMDNAERVEIVKGPASVFFGQAAPGGIINVITRKPLDHFAASIDYTYGSYDYNKARLDVSVPFNKNVGMRVYLSRQDSKDWRDYVFDHTTVFNPTLSWKVGDRLMVNFDYERADRRFNYPPYTAIGSRQYLAEYANPPANVMAALGLTADQLRARWQRSIFTWLADKTAATGVTPFRITDYITDLSPRGLAYNAGGPDQYNSHKTDSFTVDANYRLNDAISFRYGFNAFELHKYDLQAGLAVVNGDRTISLNLSNPVERDTWYIHQFDALMKKDFSFVKNKFVLGYQYTKQRDIINRGIFDLSSAPGGATTVTAHDAWTMPDIHISQIKVTPGVATGSDNARNFTRGYAANWFGEWFEGGRLTTMAGARYEEDIRERIGGASPLPTLKRHATVPTFGATYQLMEGYSVFASYSENFAPNGIRSISGPGVTAADNPQDLPVELGKGVDVGVKAQWLNNRLSGSLSFYRVDRTNVPQGDAAANAADPRNAGGLNTPTSVQYFASKGLHRTEGAELDLVFQPTHNYQLLVSGSWMWTAKVIKDTNILPANQPTYDRTFKQGRRLANTPEYTFAVWNKYTFTQAALKGWEVGLGVRYVAEEQPRGFETTSWLFNPAFTTVNAMLGYKMKIDRHPVTFALNVENLFDRFYYEGNTLASDPRKVYFKVRFDY